MVFYTQRNYEEGLHCRFCNSKIALFEVFPTNVIVCSHCMEQLDDIITQLELHYDRELDFESDLT